MAKTLDKSKKRKSVKSKNTNNNKKHKTTNQPESSTTPYSTSSSSSSDSTDSEPEQEEPFDPQELRDLLQPYSKDQLVDLLCSSSRIGSSVYSAVLEAADRDVTHRKIFVYGLPWETTRDGLFGVFEGFGEIEECTVVIDKVTGKAKGFGFVTFTSRKGAKEALKEPKKRILNRTATCQLAAMGPAGGSGKGGREETGPVKISLGQSQQQQQQQVFNGGGMAASPFMIGSQYHPVYGGGMLGNPALAAAAAAAGGGGYMYPMLASALGQMGGIGDPGGLSALGPYFRGQSVPTSAYSDDLDRTGNRGSGKDSDAAVGGSFNGYSNC